MRQTVAVVPDHHVVPVLCRAARIVVLALALLLEQLGLLGELFASTVITLATPGGITAAHALLPCRWVDKEEAEEPAAEPVAA